MFDKFDNNSFNSSEKDPNHFAKDINNLLEDDPATSCKPFSTLHYNFYSDQTI